MPIPKAVRDKLVSLLKDGAELPKELDDGVFFDNEGEFLTVAEKKMKPKLTAAEQRAALAAKEARDAALTEILGKAGVKDQDELADLLGQLADAEGTRSKAEKLEADLAKIQKESGKTIATLTKERDELAGYKVKQLKREALSPHLAKVHPDFRDMVEENLMGKIAVDGDKVVGPDGKTTETLVGELIAAKPSLKAPDFKGGAATAPNGGKPRGETTGDSGQPQGGQPNGQPSNLTPGQALKLVLQEQAAATDAG